MAITTSEVPCNKCEERNAYCHSYCQSYFEYQKENERRKAERKLQQDIDSACYEFCIDTRRRRKRQVNLK